MSDHTPKHESDVAKECAQRFEALTGGRVVLLPEVRPLLARAGWVQWHALASDISQKTQPLEEWKLVPRLLKASKILFDQACADGAQPSTAANQNMFDINSYHLPANAPAAALAAHKERQELWHEVNSNPAVFQLGMRSDAAADQEIVRRLLPKEWASAFRQQPMKAYGEFYQQMQAAGIFVAGGPATPTRSKLVKAIKDFRRPDAMKHAENLKSALDAWQRAIREARKKYGNALTESGGQAMDAALATAALASEKLKLLSAARTATSMVR